MTLLSNYHLLPPLVFFGYMYALSKQPKHSIMRSHPFLGWVRYLLEKLGPEFRQYWFDNDTDGKPFSRADFVGLVYDFAVARRLVFARRSLWTG